MMNDEMQKRITPEEYDKVEAKFVSEYGYVGPLKKSSIKKYHKGNQVDINSDIWQHHNNTFEKETVLAGIKYHYIDPENLDIDSYLLYAGLCQGLMYAYSLEAFRFKKDCSGGLFWMYNDCWGETGWTIIDYYLTRKISYYFVKRALEPIKFILREDEGMVLAVGINETPEALEIGVEYGYVSFDGESKDVETCILELPAYSRDIVLSFPKPLQNDQKGVCFIRSIHSDSVASAILRTSTYRELAVPQTKITIEGIQRIEKGIRVTLSSNHYAHAVHFNLPDEVKLSDDYFDMLPGESKCVVIDDAFEEVEFEHIRPVAVNTDM